MDRERILAFLDGALNCSKRSCSVCHDMYNTNDCPQNLEENKEAVKELYDYILNMPEGKPVFVDPSELMSLFN